MTINFCLIDAGKIVFDEPNLENLGVVWEALSNSSKKAFVRTDLGINSVQRTEKDSEEGICTVAAIITKTRNEGKTKSQAVVFSNELFVMDMPVNMGGYQVSTINLYNNKDLFLNSLAYLTKRENTITIRKSYEDVNYTVTSGQNRNIQIIIFTIPVIIIILGIVIWVLRRRKK